ncbi:hypothetical protein CVO77_13405 [Sphingopyxis lindanitolerans]|uniref:Uncharacterized protein n=1 Tax=Sphingopyxis lindanitolerans TaxID=2054227 RepID=A0A2S8B0Z9_9SPHN|nr:hypothetical protein CVO77_13405 [Sphingopyxis lindanitolerans]
MSLGGEARAKPTSLPPFVSSEVETPIGRACLHGVSTSLDTNGIKGAIPLAPRPPAPRPSVP